MSMNTFFHDGKVTLHAGDCSDVLSTMPENSIDAVVTDPPYGIKFMGREWDHEANIAFEKDTWAKVLRVLKPGGHMVCFGGTRTYHRMVCAIEDAGFEVRDQLAWVYGSGFPKSHDVSKGIDRAAGAERGIVGSYRVSCGTGEAFGKVVGDTKGGGTSVNITAPNTDAARQWQGYGTALKPAWEPICLARKPLSESTVAANVLRWGTGAINIDGCRIDAGPDYSGLNVTQGGNRSMTFGMAERRFIPAKGRWPANLCHDGSPEVLAGFPDVEPRGNINPSVCGGGMYGHPVFEGQWNGVRDSGSAARFFYAAKANANDRLGSKHPTVKPVNLMQWLVRLICPKGATVLDPFAGTGTTGAASFIEGRRCVLIEREAEYLADIERRMGMLLSGPDERARKLAKPGPSGALPLFANGKE